MSCSNDLDNNLLIKANDPPELDLTGSNVFDHFVSQGNPVGTRDSTAGTHPSPTGLVTTLYLQLSVVNTLPKQRVVTIYI